MAITTRQPISYVANKSYWRNTWRESNWGNGQPCHVYAVPTTNGNTNIYAGPGYSYGYTYEDNASSVGGNCTWWCWGRYLEVHGVALPQWGNGADWAVNKNISNVAAGDILVWSGRTYGHVQFVEAVSGDTITVSESYEGIGRDTACVIQYISKSNPQYGSTPYDFKGVYSGAGGGGGDNPDDPPDPQPGGHWEWVEETITTITSYTYTYSDIYECGTGTFGEQSGTQDTPQAPHKISSSTSRINQRWEPFNMYTDERTLTYTTDGQPVWSNWETKYTGQDNFPLGSQPTYGNGWEMEWQGDDD